MRLNRRAWLLAALVVTGEWVSLSWAEHRQAGRRTSAPQDDRSASRSPDLDGRSLSTASPHYMKYGITISRNPNGGTSNLTNGTMTNSTIHILGVEDCHCALNDPQDPNDSGVDSGYQASSASAFFLLGWHRL